MVRPGSATLAPMLITWIALGGYAAAALFLGGRAHTRHDRGAAYWTADRKLGGGLGGSVDFGR